MLNKNRKTTLLFVLPFFTKDLRLFTQTKVVFLNLSIIVIYSERKHVSVGEHVVSFILEKKKDIY